MPKFNVSFTECDGDVILVNTAIVSELEVLISEFITEFVLHVHEKKQMFCSFSRSHSQKPHPVKQLSRIFFLFSISLDQKNEPVVKQHDLGGLK